MFRALLVLCAVSTYGEHHPLLVGLEGLEGLEGAEPVQQRGGAPAASYFFRTYNNTAGATLTPPASSPLPKWLAGLAHYRLLPGVFPDGMRYHFDGLATVLKFSVATDGASVSYFSSEFASAAAERYDKGCVFFGTGTGPTLGSEICFENPSVNLLPIAGQLWLTIDTSKWGRVDPDTLETIVGADVQVESFVLNAHPACDRATDECFVQHPCPSKSSPLSDQACISKLVPGAVGMTTTLLSRATIPKRKIIQHSHSPCLTENWVVSKLDAFVPRNPLFNGNGGLLRYVHQGEDSLWMVMDRHTLKSRVMSSAETKFVNNHFWNCYEDPQDGDIVVEVVGATENYLDAYFDIDLEKGPTWTSLFHPATRCRIPANGTDVSCSPLMKGDDTALIFDYPTFNPLFKMRHDYRYFYGIAARDDESKWFDTAVKIDAAAGRVAKAWSSPGVFLTEFDFVPRTNGTAPEDEDDGVLLTVLYNATNDKSLFGVFDCKELTPLGLYEMDSVVPFHAHGISCRSGEACFTNP